MPELTKKIAVIGAGNMGAALIGGILKAGVSTREHILATTRSEAHAQEIAERFSIRAMAGCNREAVDFADLVILSVKPSTLPSVLEEVHEAFRSDQILLSLAASLPISVIERLAGRRMPVFQAMPNIPVVVEEGATAISFNSMTSPAERQLVEGIFRAVGVVCWVDEENMDAVTALSGSGPAYIYMVIEALIAGGLKMGLSREIATKLAEQTVLGAAKLVRETGLHPAILRDQVITPGGVTISAIHELERHGLRAMLISALETATNHSRSKTRSVADKHPRE